jgi:hypothetical protein
LSSQSSFLSFPGQFLKASAKPASQLRGGSAARQEALLLKMISNQLFSSLYVLNAGAINFCSFELRISFFPNFWRDLKRPTISSDFVLLFKKSQPTAAALDAASSAALGRGRAELFLWPMCLCDF